jgi:Holliday junction resolvasome RuvABC DNA-binding subunit
MEALLTIPGIGKKTAIELVTVTDGFRHFESCCICAVGPQNAATQPVGKYMID